MASPTRRTPLSTASTKEWTQNTQQKETNTPNQGKEAFADCRLDCSVLKGEREGMHCCTHTFLPRHPLHSGEKGIIAYLR
jgi:hypothetical protein